MIRTIAWVVCGVIGLLVFFLLADFVYLKSYRVVDPNVRPTIERINGAKRRLLKAYTNLYIVAATQQFEWDKTKNDWSPTKAGDHFRLWIESLDSGRWRIDHDPEITEWTGGAAAFAENRYVEAYDGVWFFKIDHCFGGGGLLPYSSQISSKRPFTRGSDVLERSPAITMLPSGMSLHQLIQWLRRSSASQWKVAETNEAGRALVVVDLPQASQGPSLYHYHYIFDPGRGDAYGGMNYSGPGTNGEPKILSQTTVSQWKHLSADVWIPATWESSYRATKGSISSFRMTYQMETIAHFSAKDANSIFNVQDVVLGKQVKYPSKGPAIQYTALPP